MNGKRETYIFVSAFPYLTFSLSLSFSLCLCLFLSLAHSLRRARSELSRRGDNKWAEFIMRRLTGRLLRAVITYFFHFAHRRMYRDGAERVRIINYV